MQLAKPTGTIALLALLPVLPYAFVGYAGQDFQFHASAWLELRNAWLAGHLLPGWAPMANFTLGDPHLVLYPPVSLLLGAGLSLLLPFQLVPAAFVWIALTLAGLSMYRASGPLLRPADRLPAAVLYMLSPYLVTTALVRFAAAELLVQAWLPWIVLCFYRATQAPQPLRPNTNMRATLLLGVLLGLTWLTNLPASLILFYGLLVAACVAGAARRSLQPILRFGAAQGLGAALAAIYLLPVWFERAYINQAGLFRSDLRRWLLFMPRLSHQPDAQKVFQFSCWLFALTGIALILLCLPRRATPLARDGAAQLWVTLAGISLFFQLSVSLWLWNHLPMLLAAEFPFRFLPLLGVVLPLLLFAPATRMPLRKPACLAVGLLTLFPFVEHIRNQVTPSTRVPPTATLAATWQSAGYEGLAEYWPAGIAIAPARTPNPPGCAVAQAPGTYLFHLSAAAACNAELPIVAYPWWHAVDEFNRPIPLGRSPAGLVTVAASPGTRLVRMTFQTASRRRAIGALISLAALLATAILLGVPKFGKLV